MKTYYYLFCSFIAYAFMGWVLEVTFQFFNRKKFINRGFLYGPVCPMYGISAVLFIIFLTPVQNSIPLVFIIGTLIASIVELITGYVMEMLFNAKWWDYTHEKYNIKGYICLKFSVIWGVIALIFIKVINPNVSNLIYWIVSQFGEVLYNIILIVLIVDIVLTINSLVTFRQVLIELQEILIERKNNMDKLKETISIEASTKIKTRIDYLGDLRERLAKRVSMRHRYLLEAYPHINSKRFSKSIDELKNNIIFKIGKN